MPGTDFTNYAFISLGANLPSQQGDPVVTLKQAIERLRPLSDQALLLSSFWRSSPIDCPPGSPLYVNAVAALLPRAEETPLSLLRKLQAIEHDFGRRRSGLRNEPRVLDLDLISFLTERCNTEELTLPHPRAHQRRFVLEPLCEITGESGVPGVLERPCALSRELSEQEIHRIEG